MIPHRTCTVQTLKRAQSQELWPGMRSKQKRKKRGARARIHGDRARARTPGLTVQEVLGPALSVQVRLVLLAVEAQQTLLIAEMTDLPTPVDGLQQLPLALTGMAPGSLRVSRGWLDLPP